MTKPRTFLSSIFALLLLTLLTSVPVTAQVAKQGHDFLSDLSFHSDLLAPSQPFEAFDSVQSAVADATRNAWAAFRLGTTAEWRATVDKRAGAIAFAEGGNVAWIPGRGNSLTASDLASVLKPGAKMVDLATLETIARGYLPKVAGMLGVDPKTLVLNNGRSGQPASHVWFVDFDVIQGGSV